LRVWAEGKSGEAGIFRGYFCLHRDSGLFSHTHTHRKKKKKPRKEIAELPMAVRKILFFFSLVWDLFLISCSLQEPAKPRKKDAFDELGFETSAFEALERDFQEVTIHFLHYFLPLCAEEAGFSHQKNTGSHRTGWW
jgi:hypothetical protein